MAKIKIEGSGRVKLQGSGKIKVPYQGDIESTFFYQIFLRPYSSYLKVTYETLELGGTMRWGVFEPGAVISKFNIENGIGTVLRGTHNMLANSSNFLIAQPLLSETDYVFARFLQVGDTISGLTQDDFTTPAGNDQPPVEQEVGFYGDSYDDYYD